MHLVHILIKKRILSINSKLEDFKSQNGKYKIKNIKITTNGFKGIICIRENFILHFLKKLNLFAIKFYINPKKFLINILDIYKVNIIDIM